MKRNDYAWLTETYIAHRGLFDNKSIPENSLPAFKNAADNNFGIEMDVQTSKDGVLVVFHDSTVDRMTGEHGKVCDFTFEELRAMRLLNTDYQIPTFEEFLQAANGVNLVVEIKTHDDIGETEQKVYDALKSYKGNYCVESFNPLIIRWFKKHAKEVIRGQLSYSYKNAPFGRLKKHILRDLKLCKWNGSQFIAYDAATIATNKAVKRFSKKIPIICWTIKSQEQLDELSPYFDNIIFDSFIPERRDLK